MKAFAINTLLAVMASTALAAPLADPDVSALASRTTPDAAAPTVKAICHIDIEGSPVYGPEDYHWYIYVGYSYNNGANCATAEKVIAGFGMEAWQCVKAADGNTWLKFITGFELTGYQGFDALEAAVEKMYPHTSLTCLPGH